MRESTSNHTEDEEWTVIAYLDHWLHTTATNKRQPDTIQRYEDVLRQHLEPVLGPGRLEQFTVQDAQLLLYQHLEHSGSIHTAPIMRDLLLAALDYAARQKLKLPE